MSGPVAVDKEVCGSREKFSGGEQGEERRMSPVRPRGSVELRKVVSAFATQGFWLKNRKVGSMESAITEADSLGEKQLKKLGEVEDEEEDPATERRREYTDLGLDVGERKRRANPLPCLSLGFGNDR